MSHHPISVQVVFVGVVVLLGLMAFGFGQTDPNELSASASRSDIDSLAKKHGLSADETERLNRDNVCVASQAYRQVFVPYVNSSLPVFITSDSLLNGFHVLYEESVMRMEKANALKLHEILLSIWKNLSGVEKHYEGSPELLVAAKDRAQIIIGVALKLLGDETMEPDGEIAATIDAEAERITHASSVEKPAWLGPPDDDFRTINYSLYKPRGFYARSEELQQYFRALKWLQSLPFRVENDVELLCVLQLGHCLHDDQLDLDKSRDFEAFFRRFNWFIGLGDDWDLVEAAESNKWRTAKLNLDKGYLAEERRGLLDAARRESAPLINDQRRFPADDPTRVAQVHFRIISPYRTPDAILFQRTTDLRRFPRRFPSGLELCAVLGSSYARSVLHDEDKNEVLKAVEESRAIFSGSSLYDDYMGCLSALLEAPEPEAPAFMSSDAWKIKSCQTALAGWAQFRHTWMLQAKETIAYDGDEEVAAGFVEPVPEFFARMARLVEKTEHGLRESGAFGLELNGTPEPKRKGFQWSAEQLKRHKLPPYNIEPLWRELGIICRRLESLAHKQLRGVPFSGEEKAFVRDYGDKLAHVMLYAFNSYDVPNDDAPRIADVFFDGINDRYLEVGIGRPRGIFILYPTKSGEVLCRGAVLPYYEFLRSQPLSDKEWRQLLDSDESPEMPGWTKPLVSGEVTKAKR